MSENDLIIVPENVEDTVPTKYWKELEDGRVQCDVCPRECKMKEGQRGLCFVRMNQDDQVVMTSYGRSSGFCIDPIEKKPLNHFLPGTAVLSLGTAGCNLACTFCQNWDISKAKEMDRLQDIARPEMIAKAAKDTGSRSVAFTYNDPVIFMEYAIDIAQACHELDIKTVAVTAGYINEDPRKEFFKYMDAANVDLKAFTEDFYWNQTKGHLQPVLDTLVYLKDHTDVWFEITTLLIPDENDSSQEIEEQCEWIVKNLGPDVPLHFSAFHPDYRMRDKNRTSLATLKRARSIAMDKGINHVYTGNVHDTEGDTTFCHECKSPLIVRDWYQINEWKLTDDGRCSNCNAKIAGVFDGKAGDWGSKRLPVRIGNEGVKFGSSVSKRSDAAAIKEARTYKPRDKTNYKIMEPQVAGRFYPENPDILAATVDKLLQSSPTPQMASKAMIVPHAGYQYSGEIAARAYNSLGKNASRIKRVVLFGPPHRMAVPAIAIPSYQQYMTPLGPVDIDQESIELLRSLPFVLEDDEAFVGEHSLEVHLPFLQRVLEDFTVVPALVGGASPEQVSEALSMLWGDDETLIVISSDLSHFHNYDKAQNLDNAAVASIESLRLEDLNDEQACGRHGIKGLLLEAIKRNMRATAIDVRNSGDTPNGDKGRVVGYGSFVFEYSDNAHTPDEYSNILMNLAKQVVIKGAETGSMPKIELTNIPRSLFAYRSAFVTITINNQLRGCYGSFIPNQPLIADVGQQAFNAAFKDSRFKPMNMDDIKQADIGISILGVPCRFQVDDEKDLINKLTPYKDGIILREGNSQALFLPSVWEQIPEPEEFIKRLKVKAGWDENYWSDNIEVYRYTAEKIGLNPIVVPKDINIADSSRLW
jgi:pyruvate formate lyase activating enzyme